ncbi:MAG: 50S ribosomal protein L11 methyltransferase [Acidimicrobiia bacterium]
MSFGWQVVVVVDAGSDQEAVDLALDRFWFHGADAVEERPDRLIAGFARREDAEVAASETGGELVEVTDDSWLDTWRAYAREVRIADRLVVRPAWLEPSTDIDTPTIAIDPGHSFGSGDHPSTRLVLHELAALVHGGETVFDVGCGSGVLAIAAVRLGGSHAVAIDIEPQALDVTVANAAANHVDGQIDVSASWPGPNARFDLVLANIGARVLREMAPALVAATGRTLILSGLMVGQADPILDAFGELKVVGRPVDGEWEAVVLERP